jgi:MYXO-CTERM domain-containing protein
MRKSLIVGTTTLTLLFGGAGVANAAEWTAAPQTTITAAEDNGQNDHDNTGLWGLVGLLGLVGLAGLKRRKDADYPSAGRTTGTANPPRP